MNIKVFIISCLTILITTGCTAHQSVSEEKKVVKKPAEHTWEAERARKAEAAKRAKNAWKTVEVIKRRGAKRAEDAWKAQEARKEKVTK
jgi:IgA-specific serine endopeptidase